MNMKKKKNWVYIRQCCVERDIFMLKFVATETVGFLINTEYDISVYNKKSAFWTRWGIAGVKESFNLGLR